MKILLTGATGFVGRAVCLRLMRDGHAIRAFSRDPHRARALLGADVEVFDGTIEDSVEGCDAIVHLAGEPVVGRWTKSKRERMRESRVRAAERLLDGAARAAHKPSIFVSASAVGYYGDRPGELLDEHSPPGEGFLAELCLAWEHAAERAESLGMRRVSVRIGVVLGREGGALAKMLGPAKLGIGGRIGDGRQMMPWIHLEDLADIFAAAIADPRVTGAIAAVAPNPIAQLEFSKALGRALGRPSFGWIPAPALRAALGEAASILLASTEVRPTKMLELGFRFRFPEIGAALDDLLVERSVSIEPVRETPIGTYFDRRKARWRLAQDTIIDAPVAEVFDFFSRAENLGALTPPEMSFDILSPRPLEMHRGAQIDYAIEIGPASFSWRSEIQRWEPGRSFIDVQLRGPYAAWWHEHRFEAISAEQTRMCDTVYYAPPLGVAGELAQKIFVAPKLRRIFAFRTAAIRFRFGRPEKTTPASLVRIQSAAADE